MALNLVYHSLYSDDYLWCLIFRGRQKGTITYPNRKPLPHFSHGWSNSLTMSLVCNYSRKLFLKINCTMCFVFNRSALKTALLACTSFEAWSCEKLCIQTTAHKRLVQKLKTEHFFQKFFAPNLFLIISVYLLEKISSYFIWISAEKTRLGPFNSFVLKKKNCTFLIKF